MRFANLIYKSAKIRLDKRAGELKAEILMGIFKSWNGLIISCNEKFITLKVSWPSWTELCGVLGLSFVGFLDWSFVMFIGWSFMMVLGSILILGEALILYIVLLYWFSTLFKIRGFGVYKFSIIWLSFINLSIKIILHFLNKNYETIKIIIKKE